jgi:hypothetical protein
MIPHLLLHRFRLGSAAAALACGKKLPNRAASKAEEMAKQENGKRDEAREWARKLLAKKRTLPRNMQRSERPWFRKGKALLKQLANA